MSWGPGGMRGCIVVHHRINPRRVDGASGIWGNGGREHVWTQHYQDLRPGFRDLFSNVPFRF